MFKYALTITTKMTHLQPDYSHVDYERQQRFTFFFKERTTHLDKTTETPLSLKSVNWKNCEFIVKLYFDSSRTQRYATISIGFEIWAG